MSRTPAPLFIAKPDAAPSLTEIAESLVRRAGATGVLPTPVDDLIAASSLSQPVDPEPFIQRFMDRLQGGARETFASAMQKLRGIADLREKAIYIPADVKPARVKWVKTHELAHQVIPWHHVNTGYSDDDMSLSQDAQELFDQEANFFAGEVIFQGRRFRRVARDYAPSFAAVFNLADEHGASRHATLWRFVEDHDEQIAAVTYWPSQYAIDLAGYPVLRRGKTVASPSFLAKHRSVDLPQELLDPHPWVGARKSGGVHAGEIGLPNCDGTTEFQWEAWWNSYSLFVLIRRRPMLHILGGLFTPR